MTTPQAPVTVIGGGIMGAGIAHVSRVAGRPVRIVEVADELLGAARDRVERYAARADGKLAPIEYTTDLETAVRWAPVVVEAVPEDLELKQSLFKRMGTAASDEAILASNTSGLSIAALATASGRPAQVVGLHFFNPVPSMPLVEVVRADATSDDTVCRALRFCHEVGKETVDVRDRPGFVTTRLIVLLMCEAIRAHEEGVAEAEHLDAAMRLGFNHPMGPLELADRVGLDTVLAIADDLRGELGPAFEAPDELRRLVAEGRLGRKSGAGFYQYAKK